MGKKKKPRIALDQSDGFGSSLGAQLGLSVAENHTTSASVSTPISTRPRMYYQIELRVSRKGYGGKTVTECSGINDLDKATKTEFSRSLSKSLGVRVFWKAELCCVQGDQVDRLLDHLTQQGHDVRAASR